MLWPLPGVIWRHGSVCYSHPPGAEDSFGAVSASPACKCCFTCASLWRTKPVAEPVHFQRSLGLIFQDSHAGNWVALHICNGSVELFQL
mmetsp:Transcript_43682/g.105361  ORF Transcript_43682/g.105361 Transcript_43682/m.105361 type:complete len:89 (-) Transcript_43682:155-421(-)